MWRIVFVTGNKEPCVALYEDCSVARDRVHPLHNASILRAEWVSVVQNDLHMSHALTADDRHNS